MGGERGVGLMNSFYEGKRVMMAFPWSTTVSFILY